MTRQNALQTLESLDFDYLCNMKCILLIALVTILTTAGSCGDTHRVLSEMFPWPATDIPEADSLFAEWSALQYETGSAEQSAILLNRMRGIALTCDSGSSIDARLVFMECSQLSDMAAARKLDSAVMRIDSSQHPYEYNKLMTRRTRMKDDYTQKYIELTRELDYFSSIGDSLTMASLLHQTAILWKTLGDDESALKLFTQAGKIWDNLGMTNYVLHNRLNIANASPPRTRDSIYACLRNDRKLKADTSFRELIFRNSFLIDNSLYYIQSAASLADSGKAKSPTRALNYALISQYYMAHGKVDTALNYARKALSRLDTLTISTDNRLVTGLASEAYNLCGIYDSANYWLRVYVDWGDTLQARMQIPNIMKMQARRNIEILNRQHEAESKARTTKYALFAAIILCVFSVGMSLLYVRDKKRKLKEKSMKLSLELSSVKLRSAKAIFNARYKPLEELKSKLADIDSSHIVSSETVHAIRTAIRENLEGSIEDASFFEINAQTSPEFIVRLKHDYPDLTERQLALSCYVASGMSSHQIARVLNISSASVNKARYRLRVRLGLQKEQDLEEFLRSYNSDARSDKS